MRRMRDERGMSGGVELALVVPVVLLILMGVVLATRVGLANSAVGQAAADAARSASLARTASEAKAAAARTAAASLANQNLECASRQVQVDVSGFAVPVGTPSQVEVRVVCQVRLSDLPGLGVSSVRVEQAMSSPLDTFRERR